MSLHVGDTAPRFTALLTSTKNGTTSPANLTGVQSIVVAFRKPNGSSFTLPATADAPATSGAITADAWGTNLDVAGQWRAQARVTYSDGTVQTFGPDIFTVAERIA